MDFFFAIHIFRNDLACNIVEEVKVHIESAQFHFYMDGGDAIKALVSYFPVCAWQSTFKLNNCMVVDGGGWR